MGWLVGSTLASMVTAFVVVKIFDYIFAEATSGVVRTARAGLFIGTWTAVTVRAGMRGFSKRIASIKDRIHS